MQYRFLDLGAEKLIEHSQLPTANGIAVAVRSTGYDTDEDEALQLCIVDLDGSTLFDETVKPQNVEEWPASDAAGGITPADVANAPELYQFEERISDLFENAEVAVGAHMGFVKEIIESSWVTLPAFREQDLIGLFCATHATADRPDEPATAASLQAVAAYYGVACDGKAAIDDARACAACYKALVDEHARERASRGADYWREHDERVAAQAQLDDLANEAARKREKNFNRMNGLLWVAACLIFVSLVIQLYQRGGDVGFMVVAGAFAVFALARAIASFRR